MTGDTPAYEGGEPIRESVLGYGGQTLGDREREAVVDALDGDYITRGPTVEAFEEDVASFLGVDHAVAVTSGTAALHIAGLAAGFDSGNEVVTTPLTFAATANAAVHAGAEPVFADVKRDTRNIDPEAVREVVTDDTAGLIPVHYAGQPCDVDALLDVADEYDLTVIWDACHAFGSSRNGDLIGDERDMATFSFHPVKNITTAEGGMVVTNDDHHAERLRSLRSFEMNYDPEGHEDEPWYQVTEGAGFNYNFTDIQAALGRVQLDRIDSFKDRRDEIVATYDEAFADVPGLRTPTCKDDADPMWHLYAVEVDDAIGCDRKRFVNALHAENIGVQVHYVPLHYHPFFQREYGYERGQFPVAETLYDGLVSLPLFPGMSDEDVTDVIRAIERLHAYYSTTEGQA